MRGLDGGMIFRDGTGGSGIPWSPNIRKKLETTGVAELSADQRESGVFWIVAVDLRSAWLAPRLSAPGHADPLS